jgi:hypothetical protein
VTDDYDHHRYASDDHYDDDYDDYYYDDPPEYDDDWDDDYPPPRRGRRPYSGPGTGPTFLPPPMPGYPGGRGARPGYRPSSSGLTLGVIALIVAALCGPGGLVVGLIALSRGTEPHSTDRICAWIAIAWGTCGTAACVGLCMLQQLAGLTNP